MRSACGCALWSRPFTARAELRLYHTPETEAFWREALAAGVDLLGTDHIAPLRRFLERADARLALAP
jgi:hypothetical protein